MCLNKPKQERGDQSLNTNKQNREREREIEKEKERDIPSLLGLICYNLQNIDCGTDTI